MSAAGGNDVRVRKALPILAAVSLIAFGFVVEILLGRQITGSLLAGCVVVGAIWIGLGRLLASHRGGRLLAKLSLAILVTIATLASLEGLGRLFAVDFARFDPLARSIPIYYRVPDVPVGGAFFRRPGPATWNGQVISAMLRSQGYTDNIHADESAIVVEYDTLGFRNPADMKDWEIVVAGDSFVEAGYLRYEDLFTTLAGRRLGWRVKNLGVSHTGPLTQHFYLKEYGRAPSAKHAVLTFFEGNDLDDLRLEAERVERFLATGQRAEIRVHPQTSFLRIVFERLAGRESARPRTLEPNAYFLRQGGEVPVVLQRRPPNVGQEDDRTRMLLRDALADWAAAARAANMQPWLLYMPDVHRVLHGHVRYRSAQDDVAGRAPSDLPQYVEQLCGEAGIRFINPIPSLRATAKRGESPYNTMGDTHLNRLGSAVVAEVLGDARARRLANRDCRDSLRPGLG